MSHSRQEIISVFRRAGLPDVADEVLATLPDPIDAKILARFCTERGLSWAALTDRMGGGP